MTAQPSGDGRAIARNLADLLGFAATANPDKPAVICSGRTLTWRELDAQVDRAAAALAVAGSPGDRVALLLANTPEFVVGYFGALRAGCVVVPLNPGFTAAELTHQLGDSGARLLLTTAEHVRRLEPARDQVPDLLTLAVVDDDDVPAGGVAWSELVAAGGAAPTSHRGAEDLAVLLYTSGTSGRPKGAMLSHRALLANLDQLDRLEPPVVSADDVVLGVLPLFHVYGLNGVLGMVARAGATIVLHERFDPVETLSLVRQHDVTNVIGAPPMYVAWSMLRNVGDAFATVRLAVSGAAPLPPQVFEAMLAATGKPVYEGYGLTETAPVLTTTLMSAEVKSGSIGRPIPGVQLRLLDEGGAETEEGDPGEIVVRGANLFSGYWPDGDGGPDADGWFPTGDVAYADADGDLYLVDRRRELILVSGFNVYPREVEDVLVTHPDVTEAAVIGVPHPYTGESVKALVVVEPGTHPTADSIIEHAAKRLARFKCPTSVQFVDRLPHSAVGKVAKGVLRDAQAGDQVA
jgi:long-chain acyl-CoA synthetase